MGGKKRRKGQPLHDADVWVFPTVLIAVAFLIGAAGTILATGGAISDANPATYIIVPMLMAFPFIFFVGRHTRQSPGARGPLYAVLVLVAYLLLLSYLRVSLSYAFMAYRIDALMLPLLLASIVLAVLGTRGLRAYAPAIIYLLFASPLLLMPLLRLNGLAGLSAHIVYDILNAAGAHAALAGGIITVGSTPIVISSATVPIGIFIALLMLLVPLAYLYEGSAWGKMAWIVSALALLLVLDIARLALVSLALVYYGVGGVAGMLHSISGQIAFYLSIILMLLLYRRFGLGLNIPKGLAKRLRAGMSISAIKRNYLQTGLALFIGIAVLLLSIGYQNAVRANPLGFGPAQIQNSSYPALYRDVLATVKASGQRFTYLGNIGTGMLFELGNGTGRSFMAVNFYPFAEPGANLLNYTAASPAARYLLGDGITLTSVSAVSNRTYRVSYFALPYSVSGKEITANFELFTNSSASQEYCMPGWSGAASLETLIYNAAYLHPAAPTLPICSAYRIALVG